MFSNDDEIVEGLKQTGSVKRKAEDKLFSTYAYFMPTGQKKYDLDEDHIFTAYSETVFKTISKITNNEFEGRSSLKTYMHSIFHNNCVDLLRKKSSNKYAVNKAEEVTGTVEKLSDPAKSIIQTLIEKTDLEILKEKLKNIGSKCKDLLELFLEGHSDKIIAQQLHYSNSDVVRTSRGRCIEKLRQ